MFNHLTLRAPCADDEPFLFRVFASTREDELKLTGWGEAQTLAFLRMQYHAQSTHYRTHFSPSGYEVILVDALPAGRIFVDRAGDQIRIVDIALLPDYRGRGIGGTLIRNVLAEADRAGKPARLHVERFNPAIRLYLRLGFRPIDEGDIYVEMEWTPASGR
jgi:ribosomal protein S18 acetylase RimI-like enzyme